MAIGELEPAEMKASRAALEFLERCGTATSADEVKEMLFAGLGDLGFRHVACCSHVDPLDPPAGAVVMINYPAPWLQRFSEEGYAARDPVFLGARRSGVPFFWNDLDREGTLARDQKRILREAAEFGLKDGLTFPIHMPGALPASCSLAPGPDGFDPLDMPGVFMMAIYAHETARAHLGQPRRGPLAVLSARERECLQLAARGKSDWTIAAILGIRERTVHNTIERAKRRLGVATRVQAVVRAVVDGQIPIETLED